MSKPPLKRNEAFTYGDDQERPPLPSGPRPEIWAKHVINPYVSIKGKEVGKENNKLVLEDVEGGRRRRKTRKDRRRKSRKTRANRKNRKTRNNY